MKRSILTAILGMATAVSALAQGHVLFSSYQVAPYSQIYWANGGSAGQALKTSDGITFQMFYGAGVLSDYSSLTPGLTFQIDNTISTAYDPGAGHGAGGYYINVLQVFPWSSGAETFGIKVITPGYSGETALWQEQANIVVTASPPSFAGLAPGLAVTIVPEPTTMALAGLGAAALLIFRRRQ